ncbi:porin [Venatoribacter cucullus]|uniref:Porin n=1 Tax=Venatoribacter cucullus TaxID=2661630 RepID=A0A9X7UVX0_9GAMM|nr:porin [Venatoribacter cucullus]QQD23048.1 porin [Venatoribacter cucullus]
MKKLALAIAIATTPFMAGLAQAADGEPELYGRVNLGFQYVNEADLNGKLDGKTELRNNSSRIGVKGSQVINDAVTAIYQVELRINPDALGEGANEKNMQHRNSFIGFKGEFGTVKFGTHDTPLKLIQDKIDLFSTLDGDMKEALFANSENRGQNMLMYTSPSLSGFTVDVAHLSAEEEGVGNNDDDGISAAVSYKADKMYFGIAYDDNVKGQDISTLRASARINIAAVQLGAIYEQSENKVTNFATGDDKEDGWLVSAAYTLAPKVTLKAQYGQSDMVYKDGESVSVGADYQYAKNTRLMVFSTLNSGDKAGKDESASYNGVAVEYRF